MPSPVMPKQVIAPGRDLVKAAMALESPKRAAGVWPYQWIFPGPNSRHVLAQDQQSAPAVSGWVDLISYQVPDGMRFSLRAIVFGAFAADWVEGSGDLLFTLSVIGAGPRNVDFLANVATRLGSTESPFPILGRLEFDPLDTLVVTVQNVAVVAAGPPNVVFAKLVGHTYPNMEAVG